MSESEVALFYGNFVIESGVWLDAYSGTSYSSAIETNRMGSTVLIRKWL